MTNLRRALGFFRADKPRIALIAVLVILGIIANVLKPWPLALIVDSVLEDKPFPEWAAPLLPAGPLAQLAVLGLAVLFLHAGQGALAALHNYLAIQVGLRGLTRVRNEVFERLQRLSLRFHRGSRAGDLIYRASWDTYAFHTLFQHGLVTCVAAGLSLILMLAVMARLNVVLALVALAIVPPLVGTIVLLGKRMREKTVAAQQSDSAITSLVQQGIAALPLTQSYIREEAEAQKFSAQALVAQKRRLSQHESELRYWFVISFIFALGTAAMVWVGASQVLDGRLTVGELLVFLSYLAQLYDPLNQLSHVGATLATASAGTRRIFEILDTPEEVKDRPDARPALNASRRATAGAAPLSWGAGGEALLVRGEIQFDHVSFGYTKERLVLREITFGLAPGSSAALIGPSGVGKSTLLNMVPRFFDPTEGAVRLDGADLRELRLKDLRAQIAVVLQEPILLATTVAENIAYGRPDATVDEIEAAAKAANADGFIARLPQRYETVVGEGAVTLSVGEKQRINLARAFLKDAPILLLDEPTNALDAESEALVVRSLFDLIRGRTTLMVAHRLSTIGRVDQAIVLEEGRISEMGAPAELAKRNGYFARVASGQVKLE